MASGFPDPSGLLVSVSWSPGFVVLALVRRVLGDLGRFWSGCVWRLAWLATLISWALVGFVGHYLGCLAGDVRYW